jgi:hypothetical protein
MRKTALTSIYVWPLALAWVLWNGGALYGQAVDTSIRSSVTVTPNLSSPGAIGGVLVTVNNQNPSSGQQLQPGDVFRLQSIWTTAWFNPFRTPSLSIRARYRRGSSPCRAEQVRVRS